MLKTVIRLLHQADDWLTDRHALHAEVAMLRDENRAVIRAAQQAESENESLRFHNDLLEQEQRN